MIDQISIPEGFPMYIYYRKKSKFNNVAQKQTHAEENKTIGERKSARPDLNNAKQ